jgi:hypothetical protein
MTQEDGQRPRRRLSCEDGISDHVFGPSRTRLRALLMRFGREPIVSSNLTSSASSSERLRRGSTHSVHGPFDLACSVEVGELADLVDLNAVLPSAELVLSARESLGDVAIAMTVPGLVGTIPACAGPTPAGRRDPGRSKDHPRAGMLPVPSPGTADPRGRHHRPRGSTGVLTDS